MMARLLRSLLIALIGLRITQSALVSTSKQDRSSSRQTEQRSGHITSPQSYANPSRPLGKDIVNAISPGSSSISSQSALQLDHQSESLSGLREVEKGKQKVEPKSRARPGATKGFVTTGPGPSNRPTFKRKSGPALVIGATDSRRRLQSRRRADFDRVWNEEKLSTEMDPIELANKIVLMRTKGVHPKSSMTTAGLIVKAKRDEDYEAKCYNRMSKLNYYLNQEVAGIKKDPRLSQLDASEQWKLGVPEALRRADLHDRKRKRLDDLVKSSPGTAPMAVKAGPQLNVERVGKMLLDHLKSKELDFRTIPLKDLNEEMRELRRPPEFSKAHFTKSLYRYIQRQRGESNKDMEAVRRSRYSEMRKVRYSEKRKAIEMVGKAVNAEQAQRSSP